MLFMHPPVLAEVRQPLVPEWLAIGLHNGVAEVGLPDLTGGVAGHHADGRLRLIGSLWLSPWDHAL